ncbi:MAG: glycosyltransferase [Oscillospiraceae bacterium]|nr:glycosyltransferase [Oscillospiraceae bacterium]
MRIWVIGRTVPEEKTGMIGIFEFEQAQALQHFGDDVQVSYLFSDNRSIKALRTCGKDYRKKEDVSLYGSYLPVGGLPQFLFQPLKSSKLCSAMKKCEESGMPDAIHVHFPLLTMTDKIWDKLKSYGVPIFVTEHWSKVQTKKLEPFRVSLLKKIVEEAAEFVCVGYPLRDSVKELTGTSRELPVIPNMVSPLFHPANEQKTDDIFRFITVGRLVPMKRFNIVIDAFAKAFKDHENVQLIVAGGGELADTLKNQVQNLGIEKQVTMTGAVEREKVAELMRQADCLVSASVLETFGVPFIEAWSSGKPVIAVKPSAIEAYLHEANGMLVPPDDADALAHAMEQMAAQYDRFSCSAIASEAEAKFSQASVAKELLRRMSEKEKIQ